MTTGHHARRAPFDNRFLLTAAYDRCRLVGVVGGGFIHDVSERHGFRVDLRLHLRPNVADTEINASPAVSTRTAAATLSSGTTPSVQFSNTGSPAARSTLSGPALTEFKTRDGSGVQIDTALSAGYFWRF